MTRGLLGVYRVRHHTYDYNEELPTRTIGRIVERFRGYRTFSSTYVGPDEKDDYTQTEKRRKRNGARQCFGTAEVH
jgi:hypothetical protein